MATTPFVVERFGGLDVYNDPQEVGASSAVDMLNVDLDRRGRLRNRDGSTALTSAAASNQVAAMTWTFAHANEEVVVRENATVRPYDLGTGAAGTTQAASPTSNNAFVNYGDTGLTRLYMAAGTLYRYDVTGWSAVGAVPISPTLTEVTANDNRLAISDGGSIYFSDAGAAETFGSSNFVTLWPGDNETIKALIRWRDYLFAFKQTKFAVFTGTSTASTGLPIFNYRAVDAGLGVAVVGQAVAGEEGVYFADTTGIYLTTGDTPRYISQPVEPWLRAGSLGSLPSFTLGSAHLVYQGGRLFVTYPNGTSGVTLVYDPKLNAWMVWQLKATTSCAVPTFSTYRGFWFGEHSSKKVVKLDSSVAADQGAAVSWSYSSGAYDVSTNNRVAMTLESALWGSGSVTLKVANDHGSFDTGSSVTLGTAPAVAEGWQQIDREGVYWQHQLSGSAAAVVNRLAHYVSSVKPAGVQ